MRERDSFMTDKELRKLGRSELLELLLSQSKELESVKEQLERAQKQLQSREIKLNQAGNIAEAALQVNEVFETAQKAAEQYLENIADLSGRQSAICAQLEAESKEKADKLLAETVERCNAMEYKTEKKCEEMRDKAKEEAQGYWDEVSRKLEDFYASHAGLQELLAMRVPAQL